MHFSLIIQYNFHVTFVITPICTLNKLGNYVQIQQELWKQRSSSSSTDGAEHMLDLDTLIIWNYFKFIESHEARRMLTPSSSGFIYTVRKHSN